MKGAALCALLVLSACNASAPPASASPSPSTEAAAIEVTKQFWKAYASALSTGDLEQIASVCKRESLAWSNVRSKILEDDYNGVVTILTKVETKNFNVSLGTTTITVIHRREARGYEASAATRHPLESEQEFPAARSIVGLERFGTRWLVTHFENRPWQ